MLSFAAQSLRSRRFGDSHSPFTPVSASPCEISRGFTLVELLTVIAIIGILSAITFGVVKGVNERAAIGQAKAELGTLAQALEAYKRQYGDYPRVGSSSIPKNTTTVSTSSLPSGSVSLFNALLGWKGPKDNTLSNRGKVFVDAVNLSASGTAMPENGVVTNAFIDPWGRPYLYGYVEANGTDKWLNFILFSAGPDGKTGISSIAAGTGKSTFVNSGEDLDNVTAQ